MAISYGKMVIIGAGKVGSAILNSVLRMNILDEIVVVNRNQKKALGEVLDASHTTAFAYSANANIHVGGYEECADAKIIIVTAGVPRKPGQTRLELAKVNTGVARSIAKNIMKYAKNPLIIVVSNPVDVNTYLIQKETGLPKERVIGTGTSLDTARFRYLLGERVKVDIRDIQGYILGEHGDTQVPIWSSVNVAGEPIDHFLPADEKEKENVRSRLPIKRRPAAQTSFP